MVLIHQKIQASTLQETIIALTIVIICFGVALMVFVNVISSERAWERLNSELLIKRISTETKLHKTFYDESIGYKQYRIEKIITEYQENEKLIQLSLKVFNINDQLINQQNELIVNYQKNEESASD